MVRDSRKDLLATAKVNAGHGVIIRLTWLWVKAKEEKLYNQPEQGIKVRIHLKRCPSDNGVLEIT
jgi:hypothetical protein